MGNTTEKSSNFKELQERGVSAQQKRRKCRIFELLLVGDLSWILCGRGIVMVLCLTPQSLLNPFVSEKRGGE
jgi:hypothetical protein